MIPVNDMAMLEGTLQDRNDECAILLLLVQPTDAEAAAFLDRFNYYHFDAGRSVTIFAAGYSAGDFSNAYPDARKVCDVAGKSWWFSEKCFVEFKDQLEQRIKWRYCGEPEILILQKGEGRHSRLDFSNYVAIDICQGLRAGYIDSAPRFMEELIRAAKEEVRAKGVMRQATKLSSKSIANAALRSVLELSHCPTSIREIIGNRAFYRSANSRRR